MRRIVIILTLVSSAHSLLAQIETTQYFMTTLPQVVDANPAFMPKFKYTVGLPFSRISGYYTNNGFTYNDAITVRDGRQVLDISKWEASLPEKTYITNASQVDLLRIGVKVGQNGYVTLLSSARGITQAMFPKDIVALIDGGTAAYVGKTAALAPTFHGMTFWETGVALSIAPIEKLRVGAKFKRIYGAHSVSTEKSELLLTVADDYSMTVQADLLVKTSGIQDSTFVFTKYLTNSGWGADFGATLKITPKLTLAASITDLAYINWRHNLYEYSLNKETAKFTFSGLDVQDLLNGSNASFEEKLDSLKENFKLTEKKGTEYTTMLPTKLYLSGSYDLNNTFTLGGLFFAEQFNGRTATGWTTSMNMNIGKFMTTSFSYTVSNRSYNNLGLGLALKFGPLQIYAVGDNIMGAPVSLVKTGVVNSHVNNAHVYNGRLGLNFTWGWKKPGEDEKDSD